jgi:hypothetical protein
VIETKNGSYKEGAKKINFTYKTGIGSTVEIEQSNISSKVSPGFYESMEAGKMYKYLAIPNDLPAGEVRKIFELERLSRSQYKIHGTLVDNGKKYRLIAERGNF